VTATDTVTASITGSANVSLVCGPVDATITAGAACGLSQNTASATFAVPQFGQACPVAVGAAPAADAGAPAAALEPATAGMTAVASIGVPQTSQ
jgi:hypothetical protein